MSTFVLFGKYSQEGLKGISRARTDQATELLRKHGGELKGGYALLGETDLVVIVELPDTAAAMQVSRGLTQLLGISFSTAPAVTLEEFDRIMA